jgi:hypothetical protein
MCNGLLTYFHSVHILVGHSCLSVDVHVFKSKNAELEQIAVVTSTQGLVQIWAPCTTITLYNTTRFSSCLSLLPTLGPNATELQRQDLSSCILDVRQLHRLFAVLGNDAAVDGIRGMLGQRLHGKTRHFNPLTTS